MRKVATTGQADPGSGAPFCLCARELPALAGIGPAGRQHFDLSGGDIAATAHRLLGPTPKKTARRLRRVLAQADFPKDALSAGQIRKKQSVTGHLPKEIAAHRRHKQPL